MIYEVNLGGEPTTCGEAVPDGVSTELRLGRSASSIDIARDKRPKPTRPASIGKPDTTNDKKKKLKPVTKTNRYIHKPMPCKKNCIDLAKTSG
jgi:hypothetical protein